MKMCHKDLFTYNILKQINKSTFVCNEIVVKSFCYYCLSWSEVSEMETGVKVHSLRRTVLRKENTRQLFNGVCQTLK